MPVDPEMSLYDAVGGRDALLALSRAWHQRCLDDPVANHPFSHPGHPQHVERLAAYWGEALGGPADYTATMGDHAEVMRMHAGQGEHAELDARAVALFDVAMADVDIAPGARPALSAYFRAVTASMAAYPWSADHVPAELPFPHWSWDGPVDWADDREPVMAFVPRGTAVGMSDLDASPDVPTTCSLCGTELQVATIDFDPTNEPRAQLNPGEMAQTTFCPNPDCPGKADA